MADPFEDVFPNSETRRFGWELYHEVCSHFPTPDRGDWRNPAQFDFLSLPEQRCLLYWLGRVLLLTDTYEKRTSDILAADFGYEGFMVTEGQFKGGMLRASYRPENIGDPHWAFRVKPAYRRIATFEEGKSDRLQRYSLAHFDQRFAMLLLEAGRLSTTN